ncbi:preprotein translocase subunit SecG [Bythopirellula polymerisocia]|nr:preprotein translocase subunit SecG [Bythopirellula polymerisocia]
MIIPMFAAFQVVFQILLALVAIFLILLVLVQRGRGGGLAGALGGMGGSSAFGAKAGDIFTRVTIVAAAVWILLCIAATKFASSSGESRLNLGAPAESSGPLLPGVDSEENTAVGEDSAADLEETASTEETPVSDGKTDSSDESE